MTLRIRLGTGHWRGHIGLMRNPVLRRGIEATAGAQSKSVSIYSTQETFAGRGDSERTLARLLRRYPDRIFIFTKATLVSPASQSRCSG